MSKMSNRNFTLLVFGFVGLFVALLIAVNNQMFPWQRGQAVAEKDEGNGEEVLTHKKRERVVPENFELVGGIPRPKSDMETSKKPREPKYPDITPLLGKIKTIPGETNPSTKSVAEAFETGKHPERLTSMIKPASFDEASYKADPQKYLDTIEPGRIWQTKPVGDEVTPIKRLGTYSQKVIRGETVTLKAQVGSRNPVVFYSQKLGSFENQLTSITVTADENGIAEAQFTASERSMGLIPVLASSPLHSHQARFLVQVELPKSPPRVDVN